MNDGWQEFEREILDLAHFLRRFQSVPCAEMTPSDVFADLDLIDRTITVALQRLLSLDLLHRAEQDVEKDPYNWPVALALNHWRSVNETFRTKGAARDPGFADPSYPSKVLTDMVVLRDAARRAAESIKPPPGNSNKRTARAASITDVGSNFVLRFRSRFGVMPPISKSGPVVDLLMAALDAAGVEGADAAVVLRTAIERDTVGRSLLPSAKAIRVGGRRAK